VIRDPAALRKPDWLKKRLPTAEPLRRMDELLRDRCLHTVCESALCPNLGECFERGTATFLIMGDVCTRSCSFCAVTSGAPGPLGREEPEHVADAVAALGLKHVVVTSVTRDDLPDGGAAHYVAVLRAIGARTPDASIEVLVPDFRGSSESLEMVLAERPAVFNHNLETIRRLYPVVRPQAVFVQSIAVLRHAAAVGRSLVKSGWMVGVGEEEGEVYALLEEVAGVGVDIVTIGQYLRPSKQHLQVAEYVAPEVFERYRERGEALGLQVHAAPFVRSSFQAGESFAQALRRGGKART
jgi:lipoic acid synthetase